MILVRTVIQAQFGKGSALAAEMGGSIGKMMAELGAHRKWRVMTDLSGPFDTVVLEVDAKSLAEWEEIRPKLFQTKEFGASMARVQGMQVSGHNEYYTIEAEG